LFLVFFSWPGPHRPKPSGDSLHLFQKFNIQFVSNNFSALIFKRLVFGSFSSCFFRPHQTNTLVLEEKTKTIPAAAAATARVFSLKTSLCYLTYIKRIPYQSKGLDPVPHYGEK
jgi:hypothetical protein